MRGLESALERKKIGVKRILSSMQGLESAIERGKKDRARKHIIWYVRARKRTWKKKEIGLESALSGMRGLKNTLERKKIGLESVLFSI